MRIAILSPFYPFRGGIAQFSNHLYSELLKTNEVKAFSYTTLYPHFIFPGKSQYVQESISEHHDIQRILSSINPLSYLRTAKAINAYKPDILIVAYWISFLAPTLGIISRMINKSTKIVGLIHNAIPHEQRFFDHILARFFFKKCNQFIVLSESVKNDLIRITNNSNILVQEHPIYNQYKKKIDRNQAAQYLQISPTKKTLLFFGLIREYKGLDLLIKAMSFLDNDYQLLIAGECYGSFSKYQTLINESPLRNNIRVFAEYIPDDEVHIFFSAADTLILPYKTATQSGVVTIGYQLETPIISTNVGGLGEVIKKAGTGIVIEQNLPEKLALAIINYFQDNETQKILLNNIKREKKKLSWEKFVKCMISFLQ